MRPPAVRGTTATAAKSRYRDEDGDDAAHEPQSTPGSWSHRSDPRGTAEQERGSTRVGCVRSRQTPLRTRLWWPTDVEPAAASTAEEAESTCEAGDDATSTDNVTTKEIARALFMFTSFLA